jgi:hypothetical protein
MDKIGFVDDLARWALLIAIMVAMAGCGSKPSGSVDGQAANKSSSANTSQTAQSTPSTLAGDDSPSGLLAGKETVDPAETPNAKPRILQAGPPTTPPAHPDEMESLHNPLRQGRLPGEESPLEVEPAPRLGTQVPSGEKPTSTETAKPSSSIAHPANKHVGEKFDPLKVNGPLFVNWPQPKLTLVITGRQHGYIEPCGCAGLDRMKGGIGRRYTLFEMLRQRGCSPVGLELGGLIKGSNRQSQMKFEKSIEALGETGYNAIGLGPSELKLDTTEVYAAMLNTPKARFVSANAAVLDNNEELLPSMRIIEAGGRKLGVTAILGKDFQKGITSREVKLTDPETALAKVVPEMKRKGADYLILLAHAATEESEALARKFPDFDLVVTAGGGEEPPNQWAAIKGTKAHLVEVGEKGMNAVVIGLFDDPKTPARYQRVPLDARFATADKMKKLMADYQQQVKILGFAGLGVRPVPGPQQELLGGYVGSESCKDCHEASYKVWKKSLHSHAYETLENAVPARNFDPECISCHVVGWHPSQFFPYETGFVSREKTPKLMGVGCEDCHGPGEKHVAAERGTDTKLRLQYRAPQIIKQAEAADPTSKKHNCYSCHDLDNSPDFDFKSYWPLVEHVEGM